jgi:hypothetical protein
MPRSIASKSWQLRTTPMSARLIDDVAPHPVLVLKACKRRHVRALSFQDSTASQIRSHSNLIRWSACGDFVAVLSQFAI